MQICLGSGVERENITVGIQPFYLRFAEDATKKGFLKIIPSVHQGETTPSENKLVFTLKSKGSFSHRTLKEIVCLFNCVSSVCSIPDTYALRSCTFYLFSVSVLWHTIQLRKYLWIAAIYLKDYSGSHCHGCEWGWQTFL